MGTPTKTQTVIDLVHRLDELKDHRAKVIAELDLEIAATMKALAKLTGDAPRQGANGTAPKVTSPAPAAAPSLELIPVQPKKASFADLALDALKANPKVATADLATVLYGEDSAKARDKARAVLYFLATKAKRIRRTPNEDGWEVIGSGN